MAKYGISVREILKRTVIVEAENINEAMKKVNDAYEQQQIVLDMDDYDETKIEPSPFVGDGPGGEITDEEDVSFYWYLNENE
jgi:hypothetical protein